jgi:hypothetical protein
VELGTLSLSLHDRVKKRRKKKGNKKCLMKIKVNGSRRSATALRASTNGWHRNFDMRALFD